jgi:hypothetical protein
MKTVNCIILFVVVVFAGDRSIYTLARHLVRHSNNRIARMYNNSRSADIILFGDSRMDRNLLEADVEVLTGKSCLNLALGGNHVLISEVLLADFVDMYGAPDRVMVEVSHSTVPTCGMGEMRVFACSSTKLAALAKAIDPVYSRFAAVFKSLEFNDPSFWRIATQAVCPPPSRALHGVLHPDHRQAGHAQPVERPIYADNIAALGRIGRYADAHGIDIVFFIAPSWDSYTESITNMDEWRTQVRGAIAPHKLHDYSGALAGQVHCFNDELHLNAAGAHSFAEILARDGCFGVRFDGQMDVLRDHALPQNGVRKTDPAPRLHGGAGGARRLAWHE